MIKKFIKKSAQNIKKTFKLYSYQHTQIYKVSYQVQLHNKSLEGKKCFLIIPIPIQNDYQQILSDIKCKPEKASIQKDPIYTNRYIVWETHLSAGESKNFSEDFTIEVKPKKDDVSKNFQLKDYEKMDKKLQKSRYTFTQKNQFINGQDEEIKKIAEQIKKGNNSKNLIGLVRKINQFVIEYLDYKNPILGLYTYKQALQVKTVDCGGFDTFFVSICNALGIPARVVCGFYAGYKNNSMHAWAEWMLPDGTWITADPSVEQLDLRGMDKKSSEFGYYGSNRIIFSVGCAITIMTADKTQGLDILQNPVIYPEIPSIQIDHKIFTSPPSTILSTSLS